MQDSTCPKCEAPLTYDAALRETLCQTCGHVSRAGTFATESYLAPTQSSPSNPRLYLLYNPGLSALRNIGMHSSSTAGRLRALCIAQLSRLPQRTRHSTLRCAGLAAALAVSRQQGIAVAPAELAAHADEPVVGVLRAMTALKSNLNLSIPPDVPQMYLPRYVPAVRKIAELDAAHDQMVLRVCEQTAASCERHGLLSGSRPAHAAASLAVIGARSTAFRRGAFVPAHSRLLEALAIKFVLVGRTLRRDYLQLVRGLALVLSKELKLSRAPQIDKIHRLVHRQCQSGRRIRLEIDSRIRRPSRNPNRHQEGAKTPSQAPGSVVGVRQMTENSKGNELFSNGDKSTAICPDGTPQ